MSRRQSPGHSQLSPSLGPGKVSPSTALKELFADCNGLWVLWRRAFVVWGCVFGGAGLKSWVPHVGFKLLFRARLRVLIAFSSVIAELGWVYGEMVSQSLPPALMWAFFHLPEASV